MGTGTLTAAGLSIKLLTDLINDLTSDFQGQFGPNVNLAPDSEYGKLAAIVADALDQCWQLLGAIYNSEYPGTASGVMLDLIAEITGVTRNPATPSLATLYLWGINATVPLGSLVAVADVGSQFATLAAVVIPASPTQLNAMTAGGNTVTQVGGMATAFYTAHGFTVGQFVWLAGFDQAGYNGLQTILTVPDANHFTFAVPSGTVSPATALTSGDATGIQAFAVGAAATADGPTSAAANTLTQIVNPISGWQGVTNASAATPGAFTETDQAFRARRLAALAGLGAATVNAITGALFAVTGVDTVTVYENPLDVNDATGRPPHSIECVVTGAFSAQAVVNAIGSTKAAGINTYGQESGTYVDEEGNSHTIFYTVPVVVPIYVALTYSPGVNIPVNADVLLLNAILSYGASLQPGQQVNYLYLTAAIASVPGIDHIVSLYIGTTFPPLGTSNIPIGAEQTATFPSANVSISP